MTNYPSMLVYKLIHQVYNTRKINYLFLKVKYSSTLHIKYVSGEACWWTLHPASKQRSEGEKVRVGDDLILVSVATERYLVGVIIVILKYTCQ